MSDYRDSTVLSSHLRLGLPKGLLPDIQRWKLSVSFSRMCVLNSEFSLNVIMEKMNLIGFWIVEKSDLSKDPVNFTLELKLLRHLLLNE